MKTVRLLRRLPMLSESGLTFCLAIPLRKLARKKSSDQLVVAVGRVPNSDILEVGNGGIKVNDKGYIVTNDYLETTAKDIWAGGDIAGKYLFKHSANLEAQYMYHNAFSREKIKVEIGR